ncbi:MAG: hypothetical protein JO296_21305 [Pseudonocardiales bacterium]|nr:hypothetical protein [Pseudonocardiales bacterium]
MTDQAPYVLSLDTALDKTGVAKIELVDGACRAYTWVISTDRTEDRTVAERCARIGDIGRQFARIWSPGDPLPVMVGIEAAALGAKWGEAHTRAGVWYWLIMPLHLAGVPIYEVAPTCLKRWAVGHGGSPKRPVEKRHMVEAMRQMWPGVQCTHYDVRHHECEALGIGQMGCQHLAWPVPIRRHHGDPLSVVKWPANARQMTAPRQ